MALGMPLHGPILGNDTLALLVEDALTCSRGLGALRKRFHESRRLGLETFLGACRDRGRCLRYIMQGACLARTRKVRRLVRCTRCHRIGGALLGFEQLAPTLSLFLVGLGA